MSNTLNFVNRLKSKKSKLRVIVYFSANTRSAVNGPPLSPILGQYGIVLEPLCKEFNERTSIFYKNIEVFVTLKLLYSDNYTFDISVPRNSVLIKRAIKLILGNSKSG